MKITTARRLLGSSKGLLVIAFLFAMLGLASCEKQGPAEEAGEKIDQTAEDAGDTMDETKKSLTE